MTNSSFKLPTSPKGGIASRVLTLPTYYGLAPEDAKSIAENVLEIVGK